MSFEELRAFAAVAEQGSFLSAAVALGVSRTTLRRQVDSLEAQAGLPLLRRGRDGVELTEAGHQLLRGGLAMEQEFATLLQSIREQGRKAEGDVRVLLPIGLPPTALVALYGMLRASWPAVQVRARFHEAPLTTSLLDVDVVMWFGDAQPSRAWEVHTAMPLRQRLIASRAYLDARGAPRTLDELARHDLLAWVAPGESEACLATVRGAAPPIKPVLATTNVHIVHECAQLGLGIGWAPDGALPAPFDREPLVPLLEDQVGRDMPLQLAVPRSLADVPRVRIFIDHLESMRKLVTGEAAAETAAGLEANGARPRRSRARSERR